MPTYDYNCDACHQHHEIFQKITDAALVDCPSCGKPTLKRGPGGGVGLQFTGSGFYITDYGSKSKESEGPKNGKGSGCCPCGDPKGPCST